MGGYDLFCHQRSALTLWQNIYYLNKPWDVNFYPYYEFSSSRNKPLLKLVLVLEIRTETIAYVIAYASSNFKYTVLIKSNPVIR